MKMEMISDGTCNTKAILFSGGYDSTCLLVKNFEAANSDPNMFINIITVNSNMLNGKDANLNKIVSVDAIINILAKKYPNAKYDRSEFSFNMDKGDINNAGFGQICLFLPTIIAVLKDDTDILFGYNAEDSISFFLPKLRKSVQGILSSIQFKNNINLYFPLLNMSKGDVIRSCLEYDIDILMNICDCINPDQYGYDGNKYIPCGTCKKCKETISVIEFELMRNIDAIKYCQQSVYDDYIRKIDKCIKLLKEKYASYYGYLEETAEFLHERKIND